MFEDGISSKGNATTGPGPSANQKQELPVVDMFLCQIKIKRGMFVLSYKSLEFSQPSICVIVTTCCSVRYCVLSVQLKQTRTHL